MPKPLAGSVEITQRCNAACIMCPHTIENVQASDMDADLAIDIVRQEVEMGCTTILPHHLGEPTLHPEYSRIWYTIRENHPKVTLKAFTNGSQLHRPEIRQTIADCADYIVVSLDGVRKETLQQVRPGLNQEHVLDGFRQLAAMQRRGRLVTQGVIVPGENDEEFGAYSRIWRKRGADEGEPYLDVRARKPVFPNPCSRIYEQVDVRVDGTVGVCCRDPTNLYPIGNIHDKPLADIWYGDKARKFRRMHRAGQIDLCNSCTWEGVYQGDDYEELE
jgi:radical SAM protein with 4Fe4S-binding SPASM domain